MFKYVEGVLFTKKSKGWVISYANHSLLYIKMPNLTHFTIRYYNNDSIHFPIYIRDFIKNKSSPNIFSIKSKIAKWENDEI